VAGGITSAAAPARANAAPWPTTMPALARPNACVRWSPGIRSTNAVLAAIWYIVKTPDTANSTIDGTSPRPAMAAMSIAQVRTAIGPIQRSRVRGPIFLVHTGAATAPPSCEAAISRPTATDPVDMARTRRAPGACLRILNVYHEFERAPASRGLRRLVRPAADGKLTPHLGVEADWREIGTVAQALLDRQFQRQSGAAHLRRKLTAECGQPRRKLYVMNMSAT
jgi:hypothetical protein